MRVFFASSLCFLAVSVVPQAAFAVKSGELYTAASHPYGRFEASIKFPAGDGVVGAFFLWKDGSEVEGTFWNELDFEKVGADCQLESNAFYGNPATVHAQRHTPSTLLCGSYHTFAFEWTPDYIAWFVDGMQLRRETGATATAYAENAMAGMQYRFNIWPGDASFGGNFDPNTLPVYQEIDWVQYSSYANGTFTLVWRDDFNAPTLDARWLLGTWDSPKGLSQHDVRNVGVLNGHAILALTSDEGVGEGVPVPPQGGAGGMGGAAGAGGIGTAGSPVSGGAGGVSAAGAGGVVSGGASGAGGAGDGGGSVSGGASGAGAEGGMNAGGAGASAVSGGASGAGDGGSLSSAGSGAGGTAGAATSVGGASGSAAAGVPGSGATGGTVGGTSSNPSSGGSTTRSSSRSNDEGGCTTSPHRPHGSGASHFVLVLAALASLRLRRSRGVKARS